MKRTLRLLTLLMIAASAVGEAHAFTTVQDEGPKPDDRSRFSEPDEKLKVDRDGESGFKSFQRNEGSFSYGIQWQSSQSAAFNRYGPPGLPGNGFVASHR